MLVRNTEKVRVSATSVKESYLVGELGFINLDGVSSLANLNVRIKTPSGQDLVPVVKQTSADQCRVELTPYEPGTYLIQVINLDYMNVFRQ